MNLKSKLLTVLPHFFNSFLVLFVYYQINNKVTKLSTNTLNMGNTIIDSVSLTLSQSFDKFTTILTKDVVHKVSQLEDHLIKINNLTYKLSQNQDIFIQKTSLKTNEVILKLIEGQTTMASNIANQNSLVLPQSNTKTYIFCLIVLLGVGIVSSYYFIPKIVTLTSGQFIKMQYLVSQILEQIPGSNSASGVAHLTDNPNFKIITEIDNGLSTHFLLNMTTNSKTCLLQFIDNLINTGTSAGADGLSADLCSNLEVPECLVDTLTGLVDISGVL